MLDQSYVIELIADAEARHAATTPGPWLLLPEVCGPEGQGVYNQEDIGLICEVGDAYPRGNNHPQQNMEWIVGAHDHDIPELIRTLRTLLEERDDFGKELHATLTSFAWLLGSPLIDPDAAALPETYVTMIEDIQNSIIETLEKSR